MRNIFYLIGRLTQDVELRYTASNKAICDVNIAVQNGKDDTSFIKVSVWGKIAETTAEYCHKGDLIGVQGIIKNHNWEDKEGKKHYDYDFVARNLTFLSTKKNAQKNENTVQKSEEVEQSDIYQDFGDSISIDDNFLD